MQLQLLKNSLGQINSKLNSKPHNYLYKVSFAILRRSVLVYLRVSRTERKTVNIQEKDLSIENATAPIM